MKRSHRQWLLCFSVLSCLQLVLWALLFVIPGATFNKIVWAPYAWLVDILFNSPLSNHKTHFWQITIFGFIIPSGMMLIYACLGASLWTAFTASNRKQRGSSNQLLHRTQ